MCQTMVKTKPEIRLILKMCISITVYKITEFYVVSVFYWKRLKRIKKNNR